MASFSRITAMSAGLMACCAFGVGLLLSSCDSRGAQLPPKRVCARIASPSGHVSANTARRRGHRRGPVQRLVDSLRPGQVGCLHGGTYTDDVTVSRSRIALRSFPGERARIVGRLWFRHAAHDDLVSRLALDGRNRAGLPSPTVNGTRISFVGVDVTNRKTSICFDIGSGRWGRARGTLIARSRIHDCGRLPADNTEHGIYVAVADDTRIVGNLIYRNADRGIQLYPDAQHTLIQRNVIDSNGEGVIFSGAGGHASSNNLVERNVITNSQIRANVESWYPGGNPRGVGNVVRENCIFGGRGGAITTHFGGFTPLANVIADPRFADPATGDYEVDATSPCALILNGAPPVPGGSTGARQLP
jgi:hypothetical protein